MCRATSGGVDVQVGGREVGGEGLNQQEGQEVGAAGEGEEGNVAVG